MKQDTHIDEHVKQLLEGHEARPALSSFDAILSKLEKKKKRRFLWIFFTGLGLTGCLSLAYFLIPVNAQKNKPKQSASIIKIKPLSDSDRAARLAEQVSQPAALKQNHLSESTSQKTKHPLQAAAPAINQKPGLLAAEPPVTIASAPAGNAPAQQAGMPATIFKTAQEPVNTNHATNLQPDARQHQADSTTCDIAYLNVLSPVFLSPTNDLLRAQTPFSLISDSIIPKPKSPFKVYLGISLTPQAANYYAHKNPDATRTSTNYLAEKQKQSTFRFTYGFGLRIKLMYKDRWEFMAGLGYQQYNYREKTTISSNPIANNNAFVYSYDPTAPTGKDLTEGYSNKIHYISHSLSAARFFPLRSLLIFKVGGALQLNQFFSNNSNFTRSSEYGYARTLVLTPHLKAGLVYDLGKKIQLQVCPDVYYSANSIFSKAYTIKQNSFGIGLEGMLLFKIR